jgi:hypothetical protein
MPSGLRFALAAAVVGITPLQATAVTDVAAWARLDYFSSTRTLDDRHGAGSMELGGKFAQNLGEKDQFRFEGNALRNVRGEGGRIRLVDAYWKHRNGPLDLWFGMQKISWGKADGLNPTDFFTPHDYTVLQPFEADQRLSIPALRTDWTVREGQRLSFVVSPNFTAERQPQPRNVLIAERQPNGLHRPQIGVRWSSTGETLDWSLSAFRGYLNSPLMGADSSGLFHHYARLNGLGADMAHNFGRLGFRAELAWLDPGADGAQGIRRQFYLVSGIDHGTDRWNINLQQVVRYTPGWQPISAGNALDATAQLQNAVNFGQLHRIQPGFTSRLSGNWFNQTLQAEILVIGYFRPNNALIRPLVTYAIDDINRITVGGEYYFGPTASFFGQLNANRTVFVEYQHFF